MSKYIVALSLSLLPVSAAFAQESLSGSWVLAPQTQARFSPACHNMRFEFSTAGVITRTTGELVYATTATTAPVGTGFLLTEQLKEHNGKAACAGIPAEQVMQHLAYPAYIEVQGDELRYFKHKGAKQYIGFIKAGT